jgi:hypothetical protein
VRSTIYHVLFLHMVNIGLQIEICACGFVWRVNNSRKLEIFCNVLYHLNVIFLQHVFEGLKSIFSNSKTMIQRCTKGALYICNSNERAQINISNGVNCLSNRAFMRKLQHKQWRVNIQTHLTSKNHNFFLRN